MPPTGKMTEELAARRVRHAVQADKNWNEIDIQFLKQQGKLDDLCEKINCDEFTMQVRQVPEPDVQIPVGSVHSGLATTYRTHTSESRYDCNCERSDNGSDVEIFEISERASQARVLGHKRMREDPKLTSNNNDEVPTKVKAIHLPPASRLTLEFGKWLQQEPDLEAPDFQVNDIAENEIPVGQLKLDPIPKRIVVASTGLGKVHYYVRNWTVKGQKMKCGNDYGVCYPSDTQFSWDWEDANRNILWMEYLVQARATRTAESLYTFLTDETHKNAKSDKNSPYKNGEDFRAHPWLGNIWDLTAPNKTAKSLSDPERTPGDLFSILNDLDHQCRLMYGEIRKAYNAIEKCSQDESNSLADCTRMTEQHVAKVWEQMHAMVHTMYATRKQPKVEFTTLIKFGKRPMELFGVSPIKTDSEGIIFLSRKVPTLKSIYLEEAEQRDWQLTLLHDAQSQSQRAHEAPEAQQGRPE
ncbi:hypothetical protein LTR84_008212 [Exophiala bonariae]|uniref:Uncharacterized protein n=1 Tax=Exophiala bonariae TaxID=1690606 RepID=A0AAV9N098_9EURO|nr:hypothetical protein LTR84_008212 [Exophiala bonariae]